MPSWSEINAGLSDARASMERADLVASDLARLLVGRVGRVKDKGALAALKRELRDFDLRTWKWKGKA